MSQNKLLKPGSVAGRSDDANSTLKQASVLACRQRRTHSQPGPVSVKTGESSLALSVSWQVSVRFWVFPNEPQLPCGFEKLGETIRPAVRWFGGSAPSVLKVVRATNWCLACSASSPLNHPMNSCIAALVPCLFSLLPACENFIDGSQEKSGVFINSAVQCSADGWLEREESLAKSGKHNKLRGREKSYRGGRKLLCYDFAYRTVFSLSFLFIDRFLPFLRSFRSEGFPFKTMWNLSIQTINISTWKQTSVSIWLSYG